MEMAEIKDDLEKYLGKQRQHFGVKITFHGTEKKRYQIEVPESQVKKVGSGYELQSQRKGFKRYYTAEGKVSAFLLNNLRTPSIHEWLTRTDYVNFIGTPE